MRKIDADKLIDDIMEDKHHRMATSFQRCLFADIVREAETVDDVKHGAWVIGELPDMKGLHREAYVCSVCGSMVKGKRNYCADCGTKMDLEVGS